MKRNALLIALCALAIGSSFAQTTVIKKRTLKTAPLQVIVNARNADIYIDGGRISGDTAQVDYGTHTVKVTAPGFMANEQTIKVAGPLTIKVDLQPAFAKLTVIAKPREALILVDGERMRGNPMTVNMGTHTVTVKANGYRDYEEVVQVDGNVTVEAALSPSLYRVQVQVDVPGAMITLNDLRVENGRIDLPGGRYKLKVVARGFGEYIDDVDVFGDVVIPVKMRRASSTIIIVPPDAYVNKNAKGNHFGLMELWIDGAPVKLNRDRIQIASGKHKLLFVTGGLWAAADVDLEPGETYTIEPDLILKVDLLRGRRDRDDRDRDDRDDRDRDRRDR